MESIHHLVWITLMQPTAAAVWAFGDAAHGPVAQELFEA
jgi:hypothetical protein